MVNVPLNNALGAFSEDNIGWAVFFFRISPDVSPCNIKRYIRNGSVYIPTLHDGGGKCLFYKNSIRSNLPSKLSAEKKPI